MQDNTKNIIMVVGFIAILLVVMVINIAKADDEISILERRKLEQFPEFTTEGLFNGKFTNKLDKYVTDQFLCRDSFKKIKYWFSVNILNQQDSDNLYVKENSIYKMEYPLKEVAIEGSSQKIKNVYDKYLKNMNVYYSIIPDKNYYSNDNHLKIDYSKLEEIMANNLENMQYIDIKNNLTAEDFYKTDLHWKQENILDVAKTIKQNMNLSRNNVDYEEKEVGNFYGVYYGQVSTLVTPDTIKYLSNDVIENCKTYNYETDKVGKVYDLEKYETSSDKYDLFLSGATPIISVENPNGNPEKELLLFRDSFGSSLAPFFIENYGKITLIDMRYVNSRILDKFIDFENQDVLFIYSGTVLNQNILR